MARKLKPEEHENHERWLVSYADFITLLFAFFVVMYAVSQVNEGKHRLLSESLLSAFGKVPGSRDTVVAPSNPPVRITPSHLSSKKDNRPAQAQRRQQEKMQRIARDILAALAPLVRNGEVRVTQSSRGVSVEINASVLFAPGQATLEDDSSKGLKAVAQVLKQDDHAIQVEGHTDNVPISTGSFPSNWELSAVRASTVVRLFNDTGVEAQRLTAVGYGDNRPVESNDTVEGRARNRRVTVMILSSVPDAITELPLEVLGAP